MVKRNTLIRKLAYNKAATTTTTTKNPLPKVFFIITKNTSVSKNTLTRNVVYNKHLPRLEENTGCMKEKKNIFKKFIATFGFDNVPSVASSCRVGENGSEKQTETGRVKGMGSTVDYG